MIVILGCGVVGVLAGDELVGHGAEVLGVRRTPDPAVPARFPIMAGDLADPDLYAALDDEVEAVLLAANPGLRRGRDNGLAQGVALASSRWPRARLVYTGTTAIYADAGGGAADEDAPLALDDPAVAGLVAIERAVRAHGDALTLRAPALVGPTRTHALDRLRRGERTVRGDPDRPFSYLHEADLAGLAVAALAGAFGRGELNAAAPERLTVRGYYQALARRAGLGAVDLVGDGAVVPSRWIDAGRLRAQCPGRRWRGCDDEGARDF